MPCPYPWRNDVPSRQQRLGETAHYRGTVHLRLGAAIAQRSTLDPDRLVRPAVHVVRLGEIAVELGLHGMEEQGVCADGRRSVIDHVADDVLDGGLALGLV